MEAVDTYTAIKLRFERPWARVGVGPLSFVQPEPIKLSPVEKSGIWVWICLLGPAVAYEMLAFADGPEGHATLSQVVKGLRRTGGLAAAIGLFFALIGVCIALIFHWVLETF